MDTTIHWTFHLHPPGADPGVTNDERRTIVELAATATGTTPSGTASERAC